MRTECVDCKGERERRGLPRPVDSKLRSANNPGPRCATHYRQVQRARGARAHETRVTRVYGLEPGQYETLYMFQGQRCALCQRATGASRRLSVDHDHATGLVRGLLCRPCNDMLGHLRDDPKMVWRIGRYLSESPAKFLGIKALHEDFRREQE